MLLYSSTPSPYFMLLLSMLYIVTGSTKHRYNYDFIKFLKRLSGSLPLFLGSKWPFGVISLLQNSFAPIYLFCAVIGKYFTSLYVIHLTMHFYIYYFIPMLFKLVKRRQEKKCKFMLSLIITELPLPVFVCLFLFYVCGF